MKTIKLNYREFYLFKQLAKFNYNFFVKTGIIHVEANVELLENLGY